MLKYGHIEMQTTCGQDVDSFRRMTRGRVHWCDLASTLLMQPEMMNLSNRLFEAMRKGLGE